MMHQQNSDLQEHCLQESEAGQKLKLLNLYSFSFQNDWLRENSTYKKINMEKY